MGNVNTTWLRVLHDLVLNGAIVSPRTTPTREILGYQSRIDMNNPIVDIPHRLVNYSYLFGEAYWILSGSNSVTDIARYMKIIEQYSDNGITFRGAYGPKVIEQTDHIMSSLINDTESRQAVLTIWRENPKPSKDIPCTVSMQWLIRENRLHCKTDMRSSDIWRGWVYDVFTFSMISAWIAINLRHLVPSKFGTLELGDLILTCGSQHMYESDVPLVKEILTTVTPPLESREDIDLSLYENGNDLMDDIKMGAENQYVACTPFVKQVRYIPRGKIQ